MESEADPLALVHRDRSLGRLETDANEDHDGVRQMYCCYMGMPGGMGDDDVCFVLNEEERRDWEYLDPLPTPQE